MRPHTLNIAGNTDDAAVMPLLAERFQAYTSGQRVSAAGRDDGIVLTQDGMVEGVHFRLDYFTPAQVAAKCMAVNLSDLAAMGAQPLGALVYVGLPSKYAYRAFVMGLAEGLRLSMRKYGYTVFGGDLTSARDLTISAALIGSIKCKHAMLRSSAQPGDTLFLSGSVGAASLGLTLLELSLMQKQPKLCEAYPACLRRALAPEPRSKLGLHLAQGGLASSCIDLSDSLSKSLLLLAKESNVGLEVRITPRILHPEVRSYFGKLDALSLMRAALSAEEDFELLFTARAKSAAELNISPRSAFPIGRVVEAKQSVQAIVQGNFVDIPLLGYEHFGR